MVKFMWAVAQQGSWFRVEEGILGGTCEFSFTFLPLVFVLPVLTGRQNFVLKIGFFCSGGWSGASPFLSSCRVA